MTEPIEAAQNALANMKLLYGDQHIFREVDPQAFRHVKHQYYAKTQTAFEQLGFQKLCDLEDVTVNQTLALKTYIRALLSGNRTVAVGLYHMPSSLWQKLMKVLGWFPKQSFFIDLETELADGAFLVTTTAKSSLVFEQDSRLMQQACDSDVSAQVLLQSHQRRLEEYCSKHQTSPLQIQTVEDLINTQHRLQYLKNNHREKVGYLTTTEVERIADGRFTQAVTDINSALEEIKATQKDQAN